MIILAFGSFSDKGGKKIKHHLSSSIEKWSNQGNGIIHLVPLYIKSAWISIFQKLKTHYY